MAKKRISEQIVDAVMRGDNVVAEQSLKKLLKKKVAKRVTKTLEAIDKYEQKMRR